MSKENLCYKPNSLERGDKIGLVNPVGEMNKEYAEIAVRVSVKRKHQTKI